MLSGCGRSLGDATGSATVQSIRHQRDGSQEEKFISTVIAAAADKEGVAAGDTLKTDGAMCHHYTRTSSKITYPGLGRINPPSTAGSIAAISYSVVFT